MSDSCRLVAEDLVVTDTAGPRLVAGRHRESGQLRFPFPQGGLAQQWEMVTLGARGNLWSWTVQRFAPKSPYDGPVDGDFKPYAVGYVELPGELIVESRLVIDDFAALYLGMPMHITTIAYRKDASGPVLTYAFEPETAR